MGFGSNFVFWSESDYFDTASETKPLLHLWSLGIEDQFYLVWPLLIWVTAPFRRSAVPMMRPIALTGVSPDACHSRSNTLNAERGRYPLRRVSKEMVQIGPQFRNLAVRPAAAADAGLPPGCRSTPPSPCRQNRAGESETGA